MEGTLNPSDATLNAIAHQLIENRTAENFQFWIVYGVLALVFAAVVAITTAYFMERGKVLAATDSLNARLDELRRATAASEQVKTSIAHDDWTVKEYKTLRRNKLEQLMTASFKVVLASETDVEFKFEEVQYEIKSREFMIEVNQLAALYFSEFAAETDAIATTQAKLAEWLINSRSKLRQLHLKMVLEEKTLKIVQQPAGETPDGAGEEQRQAYDKARSELMRTRLGVAEEFASVYWPLRHAVEALQVKATALMTALIAPDPATS